MSLGNFNETSERTEAPDVSESSLDRGENNTESLEARNQILETPDSLDDDFDSKIDDNESSTDKKTESSRVKNQILETPDNHEDDFDSRLEDSEISEDDKRSDETDNFDSITEDMDGKESENNERQAFGDKLKEAFGKLFRPKEKDNPDNVEKQDDSTLKDSESKTENKVAWDDYLKVDLPYRTYPRETKNETDNQSDGEEPGEKVRDIGEEKGYYRSHGHDDWER